MEFFRNPENSLELLRKRKRKRKRRERERERERKKERERERGGWGGREGLELSRLRKILKFCIVLSCTQGSEARCCCISVNVSCELGNMSAFAMASVGMASVKDSGCPNIGLNDLDDPWTSTSLSDIGFGSARYFAIQSRKNEHPMRQTTRFRSIKEHTSYPCMKEHTACPRDQTDQGP